MDIIINIGLFVFLFIVGSAFIRLYYLTKLLYALKKEGINIKMYLRMRKALKNMQKGIVADIDWKKFTEMADSIKDGSEQQ